MLLTVEAFAQSVPSAPTAVTATAGDSLAIVSFTTGNNGGANVNYYTAQAVGTSLTGSGTASPIVVTGLTNNTAYSFTVSATNVIGTSLMSANSNTITPGHIALITPNATADFGSVATNNNVTGTVSNWTLASGLNQGILSPNGAAATVTSPPLTLANLAIKSGGTVSAEITGNVADADVSSIKPIFTVNNVTQNSLLINKRNNDDTTGQNKNLTTATRIFTTKSQDIDPIDGNIHVRFAIAPILYNPGHPYNEQPYEFVQIENTTKGTIVYTNLNVAGADGIPWLLSPTNASIDYLNWQLVDWAGNSSQVNVGDTIKVTVVGSGCALGGHWGRVYLSAGPGSFGNSSSGTISGFPLAYVTAAGPVSATAGQNITYTIVYRNTSGSNLTNGVVSVVLPSNTTFVTTSASNNATGVAVGGTGTLNVAVGSVNNNTYGTFTVTVKTDAAYSGQITLGNYNFKGTLNGSAYTSAYGNAVYTSVTPVSSLISVTLTSVNPSDGSVSSFPNVGSLSYGVSTSTQTVASGTTITFTATPISGQVFLGWSGSYTSPSSTLTVTPPILI